MRREDLRLTEAVATSGSRSARYAISGALIATGSGSFSGTGMGNGSFSVDLKFSTDSAISNGGGGSCYGASGTMTLNSANGSTITLDGAGLLCAHGSNVDPTTAPTTFNGSYIVASGTGRFSSSGGTGSAVLAIDSSHNVYLDLNGYGRRNGRNVSVG